MKTLVLIFALCVLLSVASFAQGSYSQTTTAQFNSNANVNIRTSNDELRLTNDVGTGVDGNLYVPTTGVTKTDSVKSAVTGNNPSGQNSIQVYSTAGFSIGDEVLVITMQDNNADLDNNLVGQYEFKRITRKTATALLFSENLNNTYDSLGKKHQVIKVPNYSSVTIDVGGIITCDDWDGITGGVLAARVRGLLQIMALGKIDVTGKGYRGGDSVRGTFARGIQGEGLLGVGTTNYTRNLNGGGGAHVGNYYQLAGGGGGGYGDSGRAGQVNGYMSFAGQPGVPVGTIFLGRLMLGAGGGSGATDGYVISTSGQGGDGGGVVYLSCDSMSVVGYCLAGGQPGSSYNTGPRSGGGGGGSGGTVYLITHKAINLGNSFVTAVGGSGGTGTDPGSNNGGAGGNGRIRIDASFVQGTSNPPVGYTGRNCAYWGTSTTQAIAKPDISYWGNIFFSKDTSAPGTSISIDILSTTDSLLLQNLQSGMNVTQAGLSHTIDSIKLRARLINTYGNQTPILYDWSIDWRTTPTLVNEISTSSPMDYSISQNYPNPFNPNTTIEFSLPRSAFISLKIFNTLGQEVATLIAQNLNAGNYKAEWSAGNMPSGLYFCRLTADNVSATKKLMLMR